MAEAVAERLLDLHNRLISLYILNEADSLSWHSDKPFFERERCSYVIQMWWLYMQGKANIPSKTRCLFSSAHTVQKYCRNFLLQDCNIV